LDLSRQGLAEEKGNFVRRRWKVLPYCPQKKFLEIGTLTALLLIFAGPSAGAAQKAYDFVIKGATVYDGESLTPIQEDVAISGERIVEVGTIQTAEAGEVVNGEGLILSPGFIDIHTHSDFNPFAYPGLGNKVRQGVTTEVIGNCGMSAAPIEGPHKNEITNVWSREGVEIPKRIPWRSSSEYMNEAEFQGLETNLVSLVGHGNLRSSVIGMEPREAKPQEIEAMKKFLAESMEEGAAGISFGLTYLPGVFAGREELVSLCRTAAEKGGLCVFHIRSEGTGLVEAVGEAIEIGKEAGAPVHISHLKAAGEENWPKIEEAFRKIEEARAAGLKVTADAYPYTASFAELGVILPDSLYEDPKRVQRFKEPALRQRILRTLEGHFKKNPRAWDRVRIATVASSKNAPLQGKTILEISQETGKPPLEVLVDLLGEEEFRVSAFYFSQSEAVVDQILSRPYVALGSDSIADGSAMPHPRAYGTFPRLLSRCARAKKEPDDPCWAGAIRQTALLPAEILGLEDRGRIAPGVYADIVLFEPDGIRDTADYDHPKTPPEGIRWVFVNGKPAVREGEYTPSLSGLFVTPEK
jgi:N-acyl-D-aspartate/D-glutamate deacylase